MIIVTGSFTAKADRIEEALALSIEHVRRSRRENGCMLHGVHRDAENPNRLVFVEQWIDQAALAEHFAVPASRSFVRAVTAIAVEAPTISIYDAKKITIMQ